MGWFRWGVFGGQNGIFFGMIFNSRGGIVLFSWVSGKGLEFRWVVLDGGYHGFILASFRGGYIVILI